MYFVYIIQSQNDKSYYIGSTSNIEQRVIAHNTGKSVYTKKKMPWMLQYFAEYPSKSEALKREKQIKNWKSKKAIEKLIARNNN